MNSTDEQNLAKFPLYLCLQAFINYKEADDATRNDYGLLTEWFKTTFGLQDWKCIWRNDLNGRKLMPRETLTKYYEDIQALSRKLNHYEDAACASFINGLSPTVAKSGGTTEHC